MTDFVSQDTIKNQKQVEKYMNNLGYRKIGEGGRALVFAKKGKPYVVKVYQNDKCYEEFLKFARKNQNNPFYPRFYDKVYVLPGGRWKAIKMEKLSPASVNDLKNNLSLIACLAVENAKQNGDWESDTGLSDSLMLLGYFSTDLSELREIAADATELERKTAKQMISLINKLDCLNDLYISNFMMRGPQLVITDPVL